MFALICMCGGLGAVTRFVLNTSIQRWWNRAFPLSTFIINVLATFFAGVAAAAAVYFMMTVLVPVVCVALGWGLIALVR